MSLLVLLGDDSHEIAQYLNPLVLYSRERKIESISALS